MNGGSKIFAILFVIFLAGVFLYLSREGVLTDIARIVGNMATSTASPSQKDGSVGAYTLDGGAMPSGGYNEEIPTPTEQPKIDPSEIPYGFTLTQLSPHYRKIRITRVWPNSESSQGLITISAYLSGEETIPITGWTLRSNRGSTMVIPAATEVYDPSGILRPAVVRLKNEEYVNIYSGTSPFANGFRINKCMGYLNKVYETNPALPYWCPYDVDRSYITRFTGKCQDYILSLDLCDTPDLNRDEVRNDRDCRAYLESLDLTYRGCFMRHRADSDFFDAEWRLWAGEKFLNMDVEHDRIHLFDEKGLLVDEYVY